MINPLLKSNITHITMKHATAKHTEATDSLENHLQAVEESQRALSLSLRFFCYQVAFSSFTNILGTIAGHPLDTIRVSWHPPSSRYLLSTALALPRHASC